MQVFFFFKGNKLQGKYERMYMNLTFRLLAFGRVPWPHQLPDIQDPIQTDTVDTLEEDVEWVAEQYQVFVQIFSNIDCSILIQGLKFRQQE